MDNTVWVIEEHYDNNETWPEDRMEWNAVIAVVKTKEEAEKMIKDLYDKFLSEESIISTDMVYDKDGCFLWLEASAKDCYLGYDGDYSFTMENFELGKFKNIES